MKHRHNCYSTPNTCGACLQGYDYSDATGDSNEPCVANCKAMPADVCSSLHRSACDATQSGIPNTCGPCLPGYVGTAGHSNTLCLLASLEFRSLTSCREVLRLDKDARTGQYLITPSEDDEETTVYCDMQIDGGGWTSIFVSDSARCADSHARPRRPNSALWEEFGSFYTNCTRDNLRYTAESKAIRADPVQSPGATDREVMIGFITRAGRVLTGPAGSWAKFLIPAEWVQQAPMSYLRMHSTVAVSINGDFPAPQTLVFGSSYFEKDCDYRYNSNGAKGFQQDVPAALGGTPWDCQGQDKGKCVYHGYRGQICFSGVPQSPWWANFSHGDMSQAPLSEQQPGYCNSGLDAGYQATNCSATRRFAIFVRKVDCSAQPAESCKALHRHPCYSTENTCGRCLPGFVGGAPSGAQADRGSWDGNTECSPAPTLTQAAPPTPPLKTLEPAPGPQSCASADECRVRELEEQNDHLSKQATSLTEENAALRREIEALRSPVV
jgi:hypothetical protein